MIEAQGENERAEYGKGLLKFLSEKLTAEFGKGYICVNFIMLFQNVTHCLFRRMRKIKLEYKTT